LALYLEFEESGHWRRFLLACSELWLLFFVLAIGKCLLFSLMAILPHNLNYGNFASRSVRLGGSGNFAVILLYITAAFLPTLHNGNFAV